MYSFKWSTLLPDTALKINLPKMTNTGGTSYAYLRFEEDQLFFIANLQALPKNLLTLQISFCIMTNWIKVENKMCQKGGI